MFDMDYLLTNYMVLVNDIKIHSTKILCIGEIKLTSLRFKESPGEYYYNTPIIHPKIIE